MTRKTGIIDEKIKATYEKYAPKNITLEQFAKMVERDPKLLNDIGGKFSTFDVNLSKKYNKLIRKENYIKDDDFVDMFGDVLNKDVVDNIVEKYAKAYTEIICSDKDILQDAWLFDILNEKQRQELAKKIIERINKYFDIQDKIKVVYANKYSEEKMLPDYKAVLRKKISDFLSRLKDKLFGTVLTEEWINYENINGKYNSKNKVLGVFNSANFISFISTLAHEYGHFIDDNYPDIGMLGSQISFYADSILKQINLVVFDKKSYHNLYMNKPTEQSCRQIQHHIEYGTLDKVLEQQKHVKKDLYIHTMQKAINYIEMRLATIRLKYNKFFSWLKEQYPTMSEEEFSFYGAWRLKGLTKDKDEKKEYEKYVNIASKFSAEYEQLSQALKNYKISLQEFIKSENNNYLSNTAKR